MSGEGSIGISFLAGIAVDARVDNPPHIDMIIAQESKVKLWEIKEIHNNYTYGMLIPYYQNIVIGLRVIAYIPI